MRKIKRTGNLLKQYFVFNKTERKGIYSLLALLALSLLVPRIWGIAFPPKPLDIKITNISPELNEELQQTASEQAYSENTRKQLFAFNPNEADSETFLLLGFSSKSIHSMLNYRNKGGRFRKAEDLYRVYYTDSNFIGSLLPYVQLEQADKPQYESQRKEYVTAEHKKFIPVEMNTADSVALVKLYGIGPKMAAKIIDHRTRSGGFFKLEQLKEIYGIDDDLLMELEGKIYVDASKVIYTNINSVSFEQLKKHPYLRYKTANAIINYRNQHGAFKQVEDLKKIVILPDSTYNKLLPYIRLQD